MVNDITSYPEGLDLVWIGVDRSGYIGAFISAGTGPIPKFVLQNTIFLLENIEQWVLELSETSDFLLHVNVPRPDDFIALAKRGLYVYDWTDVYENSSNIKNTYELMASPLKPLKLSDLIDNISKNYLENIKLNLVEFKNSNIIDVKSNLDCVEG
ncbi:hypothetical protein [Acinetobacter courvalinii]|uniref:hypothetical protein n=1 Tax=Acinetobacter courvalinii TaxID=280147 RepID=UPI0002CFC28A|nr:hypothetical protein [Acinetobacter courvalinii]ENX05696.1 hypothetical protein F898_02640 [Acinetobacter courvalinii]